MLPEGANSFPLRAVPYDIRYGIPYDVPYDILLLLHWVTSLECYYFITHVRNCVMGATPMEATCRLLINFANS